jgi:hypothetical protein
MLMDRFEYLLEVAVFCSADHLMADSMMKRLSAAIIACY